MKRKFLVRARAAVIAEDRDAGSSSCPVCNDGKETLCNHPLSCSMIPVYQPNAGRILGCGHEMCLDCLDDMRNAPIVHDGIL